MRLRHDWGVMRRKIRGTGYRGRALLILGILDIAVATSLVQLILSGRGTASSGFIARAIPPEVLAGMWVAVAASCLIFAFRERDAFGWAAAIGIKVFWGLLSLVGWFSGEIPNGYLGAVIWWAFGALVWLISRWPEPRPAHSDSLTVARPE